MHFTLRAFVRFFNLHKLATISLTHFMTRSEDCNLKRVDAPQLGIALEEIFQFQFVVRGCQEKKLRGCIVNKIKVFHMHFTFFELEGGNRDVHLI